MARSNFEAAASSQRAWLELHGVNDKNRQQTRSPQHLSASEIARYPSSPATTATTATSLSPSHVQEERGDQLCHPPRSHDSGARDHAPGRRWPAPARFKGPQDGRVGPRAEAWPASAAAAFSPSLDFVQMVQVQQSDPVLSNLVSQFPSQYQWMSFVDDVAADHRLIGYKGSTDLKWRIVVPNALLWDVVQRYHFSLHHGSTDRLYEIINERFANGSLRECVKAAVENCPVCRQRLPDAVDPRRRHGIPPPHQQIAPMAFPRSPAAANLAVPGVAQMPGAAPAPRQSTLNEAPRPRSAALTRTGEARVVLAVDYAAMRELQQADPVLQDQLAQRSPHYMWINVTTSAGNQRLIGYKGSKDLNWRIVLPDAMLWDLVQRYHLGLNHIGATGLYEAVTARFANMSLHNCVKAAVRCCSICRPSRMEARRQQYCERRPVPPLPPPRKEATIAAPRCGAAVDRAGFSNVVIQGTMPALHHINNQAPTPLAKPSASAGGASFSVQMAPAAAPPAENPKVVGAKAQRHLSPRFVAAIAPAARREIRADLVALRDTETRRTIPVLHQDIIKAAPRSLALASNYDFAVYPSTTTLAAVESSAAPEATPSKDQKADMSQRQPPQSQEVEAPTANISMGATSTTDSAIACAESGAEVAPTPAENKVREEPNQPPSQTKEQQQPPSPSGEPTSTQSSRISTPADAASPVEDAASDQKRKANDEWPRHSIQEPHENDVLFGRGAGTNNHPGNKRYRNLVEQRKADYTSRRRLEKPLVAIDVIREWRSQDPPGRFLKVDEETGLWNDVGDRVAQSKTSQALREKPQIRLVERTTHLEGDNVLPDAELVTVAVPPFDDRHGGLRQPRAQAAVEHLTVAQGMPASTCIPAPERFLQKINEPRAQQRSQWLEVGNVLIEADLVTAMPPFDDRHGGCRQARAQVEAQPLTPAQGMLASTCFPAAVRLPQELNGEKAQPRSPWYEVDNVLIEAELVMTAVPPFDVRHGGRRQPQAQAKAEPSKVERGMRTSTWVPAPGRFPQELNEPTAQEGSRWLSNTPDQLAKARAATAASAYMRKLPKEIVEHRRQYRAWRKDMPKDEQEFAKDLAISSRAEAPASPSSHRTAGHAPEADSRSQDPVPPDGAMTKLALRQEPLSPEERRAKQRLHYATRPPEQRAKARAAAAAYMRKVRASMTQEQRRVQWLSDRKRRREKELQKKGAASAAVKQPNKRSSGQISSSEIALHEQEEQRVPRRLHRANEAHEMLRAGAAGGTMLVAQAGMTEEQRAAQSVEYNSTRGLRQPPQPKHEADDADERRHLFSFDKRQRLEVALWQVQRQECALPRQVCQAQPQPEQTMPVLLFSLVEEPAAQEAERHGAQSDADFTVAQDTGSLLLVSATASLQKHPRLLRQLPKLAPSKSPAPPQFMQFNDAFNDADADDDGTETDSSSSTDASSGSSDDSSQSW